MKRMMLVLCACGVAGAAVWLAPWKEKVVSRRDNSGGREAVGGAGGPGGGAAAVVKTRVREREATPGGTEKVLRDLLAEVLRMRSDPESLKRIQTMLDGLETDEVLRVLRELDAAEVSGSEREQLAGLIAVSLARRDPELAMDEFVGRISDRRMGMMRQLEVIYLAWASEDDAAAGAWLDRRIAAGEVEGAARERFESALVRSQSRRDPEAAAARLAAMDGEARERVLREDWFSRVALEEVGALAAFLREQAGDSTAVMTAASRLRLRQGGLVDAGEFLAALASTDEERRVLVAEALKGRVVGVEEMRISPEEARAWILEQAPEGADGVTGAMLAQMTEWHDFSEMARLAKAYGKEGGSEEVLAVFLMSAPDRWREEILEWAVGISDAEAREEVRGRFSE